VSTEYYDGKIKDYEVGGICSKHGKERNAHNILVGNPEARPRHGWDSNVKFMQRTGLF
jgi:hypothetical protein